MEKRTAYSLTAVQVQPRDQWGWETWEACGYRVRTNGIAQCVYGRTGQRISPSQLGPRWDEIATAIRNAKEG